jgi:virginiamycin B lyase
MSFLWHKVTVLTVFAVLTVDEAHAQRFPSFTNNQPLKDSVSALLPIVRLRGIATDSWVTALNQSQFHREITDTAGISCGLGPSQGLTLLPNFYHVLFSLQCSNRTIFIDSFTHTILYTSDVDQLLAKQYRLGLAVPAGGAFFSLAPSASTALHELTHSMIYRTGCVSSGGDEELVRAIESTIAAKVLGAKGPASQFGTFANYLANAVSLGGMTCLQTLGMFGPIPRFTMTVGGLSAIETQTLTVSTPTVPATISVDTSTSIDLQGTVVAGTLSLDGTQVSSFSGTPVIPISVPLGTHTVSLSVYNNGGFLSQPVTGTVVVTGSSPPTLTITEFPWIPTGYNSSGGSALTAGSDGALWYGESFGNVGAHAISFSQLARITTSGVITEFPLPTTPVPVIVDRMTSGPDGALWFVSQSNPGVWRSTTSGSLTFFNPFPNTNSVGIITGPDGALWFETQTRGQQVSQYNIVRMTTSGVVTNQYAMPGEWSDITVGPDGAFWFTMYPYTSIYRMTTSGLLSSYSIPWPNALAVGITAGADGAVWFVDDNTSSRVGRITTSGVITGFLTPTAGGYPQHITLGPDGAVWFTETDVSKIGRITPSGIITEYDVPIFPNLIVTGPDGALWFTPFSQSYSIARAVLQ